MLPNAARQEQGHNEHIQRQGKDDDGHDLVGGETLPFVVAAKIKGLGGRQGQAI
ncbi:MAG: hypothetical protein OT477_09150 [Chloroflexi bacterium]|nr:hypothetical protein [Chloroflexota bacterium]